MRSLVEDIRSILEEDEISAALVIAGVKDLSELRDVAESDLRLMGLSEGLIARIKSRVHATLANRAYRKGHRELAKLQAVGTNHPKARKILAKAKKHSDAWVKHGHKAGFAQPSEVQAASHATKTYNKPPERPSTQTVRGAIDRASARNALMARAGLAPAKKPRPRNVAGVGDRKTYTGNRTRAATRADRGK